MKVKIYREYRLKFYLNARHYIILNSHKSEVHPHTWEFALTIQVARDSFVEFKAFEDGIMDYLSRYQNKVLNEEEPFDVILPTVENMTDYFAKDFMNIIRGIGGVLLQVEASETPTRSYIVRLAEEDTIETIVDRESWSNMMDTVLDEILE